MTVLNPDGTAASLRSIRKDVVGISIWEEESHLAAPLCVLTSVLIMRKTLCNGARCAGGDCRKQRGMPREIPCRLILRRQEVSHSQLTLSRYIHFYELVAMFTVQN